MKLLVATSDLKTSDAISDVIRLRWPTSGKVIVISQAIDDAINTKDFELLVVDCELRWSIRQIKKLIESLSDIPLLYLADPHGDQMDTALAIISMGNSDYLFKPIETEALISSIESLIELPRGITNLISQAQLHHGLEDNN